MQHEVNLPQAHGTKRLAIQTDIIHLLWYAEYVLQLCECRNMLPYTQVPTSDSIFLYYNYEYYVIYPCKSETSLHIQPDPVNFFKQSGMGEGLLYMITDAFSN